jgi:H+/Cl- antiporter ClcA
MVDIDQTLAALGNTDANNAERINSKFELSRSVADHLHKWCLYDGYLVLFFIMKFLFTALTLSCPIPGGIFTPTFCMGAVFGQIYVSLLINVLGFFQFENVILYRGVYSVLGAAAFCGSVTRTVSVAVIVLELNGHLSHAVPTMVCVLCSYTISEWIKPCSFFEMLSQLGGLDDKISANGRYMIRDIIDQNEEEYKTFSYLTYDDNSE